MDPRLKKIDEYNELLANNKRKFISLNYEGHLYVLLNKQAEANDKCLCIGELIDNINAEIEDPNCVMIDPFVIFREGNTCHSCRKIIYTTNLNIDGFNE